MAKLGSTTVTGNLSVSGTINGYKLAESARRGVDTAISKGSTSTNIPTTKAIVDYVNSAINSWNSSHKATLSVNGPTVTTTAGYYAAATSKTVGNGAYSAAAGGSEATKVTVNTNATATGFTFASSGSYYITTNGTQASAGSVNATATAKIDTAGWLTAGNKSASAKVSTNATINTNKYYLPVGTISTGSSAKSGWTTNTSAVIPANGYLYIGAGFYPNTQIALATLIPDDSTLPNAGNDHILSGYEAYDTNGNKLKGTITTITLSSAYTTENTGNGLIGPGYIKNPTYIVNGAFDYSSSPITANATIVKVSKSGWFSEGKVVCKIDSDGETLVINV